MDNQATTPVDPRVLDEMMPFLKDKFGNVGSAHLCGRDVVGPVGLARKQVADLMGVKPNRIFFTSGATESDNLAIKGVASAFRKEGRHIITQVTEHKAVLDTCKYLETLGFSVTYLGVDHCGRVDPEELRNAIQTGRKGTRSRTVLISIMGANNEIGTIQPIKEIGEIAKEFGIHFHVDAAQAVGKIPFDAINLGADLVSISAHKMYGPKGIGALYIRPGLDIDCQMHGGGQEGGFRSGTLAVPMIVALGKAAELARMELDEEVKSLESLRKRLEKGICSQLDGVKINGCPELHLPGNLSVTFAGIDGDRLMHLLGQICCSATSACSTSSPKPSHVLAAIGMSEEEARASIRFGIGRFNTEDEVDFVIERVTTAVKELRGA